MAKGGRREGAGRPPGTANRKTREIADRAAKEGITPLEYMLDVLRDVMAAPSERMDAAKSAAPYVHPRLAAIEANLNGDIGVHVTIVKYADAGKDA